MVSKLMAQGSCYVIYGLGLTALGNLGYSFE
jgi:hypothetical protein